MHLHRSTIQLVHCTEAPSLKSKQILVWHVQQKKKKKDLVQKVTIVNRLQKILYFSTIYAFTHIDCFFGILKQFILVHTKIETVSDYWNSFYWYVKVSKQFILVHTRQNVRRIFVRVSRQSPLIDSYLYIATIYLSLISIHGQYKKDVIDKISTY